MSGSNQRFLIFSLETQYYALSVEDMAEVIELTATYPIPKAPHCYLGVMNCHGAPVPILDLASFLQETPPKQTGSILVLHHTVGCLALRIDSVERIVSTIRGVQVEPDDGPYTRHVLLFDKRKIPILAVELIVAALEEMTPPA
jgi:purine-binding chemotaxis protein CheW